MTESMTVVCLDDDKFILKNVTKLCRSLRPDWNIKAYDDPKTWYKNWRVPPRAPIDIFICDLTLPSLRGDELLKGIVSACPNAIRVLLSEEIEESKAQTVYDYAHVVISKPFAIEDFENLFIHAERIHQLPFSHSCREKLGRCTLLPVLPKYIVELQSLLAQPNYETKQVVNVIGHEPALVAKLLQVANSSLMGFRRTTDSLVEVVNRLGASLVEAIAVSMSVKVVGNKLTAAQHESIVEQSIRSGSIARHLAKTLGRSKVEEDKVFVASLLTSIGSIALLSQDVALDQLDNSMHFQEGFADTHIAAAYLLTVWGYELEIGNMILNQQNFRFSSIDDNEVLTSIVGIAGLLSKVKTKHDFHDVVSIVPEPVQFVLIDQMQDMLGIDNE
ncbi:HDOD domain-containing protein [Vibrio viridaestus]|uniref:HDOD domain-containing protein n=1 Tax=Vibrio viridaestus TaxID=2487322 RepID=UPI00140A8F76|nr:HDOD domain-containing protein [Vibrio viridaestus]